MLNAAVVRVTVTVNVAEPPGATSSTFGLTETVYPAGAVTLPKYTSHCLVTLVTVRVTLALPGSAPNEIDG